MFKRMERQAINWEKTFVNYNLTKDFHPKYTKNSQNSTLRNQHSYIMTNQSADFRFLSVEF